MASKTSRRGASKPRVMTISRSVGVVTVNAALVLALLTDMLLLLLLQLAQIVVQTIEALLPEMAVVLHPVGDVFERTCLQPARPPLGLAPAGDQGRVLQNL